MIVVPDASAVLSWILPDERGRANGLESLRGAKLVVPSIWPVEIANSILFAVQRKRIDADEASALLAGAARLEVEIVTPDLTEVARRIYPLAVKHRLTVYDALYVYLAAERGAILFTSDKAMRRAAVSEEILVQ